MKKIDLAQVLGLGCVCLGLACNASPRDSNNRARDVGCASGPCQFVDVRICGMTSAMSCNWMDLEVLSLTSETLIGQSEGRDCFYFTFRRAAGRAVCGSEGAASRSVQIRIGGLLQEVPVREGHFVLELIPAMSPMNVVRITY